MGLALADYILDHFKFARFPNSIYQFEIWHRLHPLPSVKALEKSRLIGLKQTKSTFLRSMYQVKKQMLEIFGLRAHIFGFLKF